MLCRVPTVKFYSRTHALHNLGALVVTHAALQHLINCHFIVLIIYLLDTNLYPFSKISVPVHLKAVIKSAPGDTPILADVAVLTQQFNQLISWIVDEV